MKASLIGTPCRESKGEVCPSIDTESDSDPDYDYHAPLKAGDQVEYRYPGEKKWFGGMVTKVWSPETCSVDTYDEDLLPGWKKIQIIPFRVLRLKGHDRRVQLLLGYRLKERTTRTMR